MTDRPRALVVLISIFLAGCIIGAAAFFIWVKAQPESFPFSQNARNFRMPPGPRRGGRGNPWTEMLNLKPEQEKSVNQIMQESNHQLDALQREYEPKYEAVNAELEPKIRAIFDDRHRKIVTILDEDQKKKFEDFLKRFEERRNRVPGGSRGGFGRPMGTPPR
jgi:hypothetical protein